MMAEWQAFISAHFFVQDVPPVAQFCENIKSTFLCHKHKICQRTKERNFPPKEQKSSRWRIIRWCHFPFLVIGLQQLLNRWKVGGPEPFVVQCLHLDLEEVGKFVKIICWELNIFIMDCFETCKIQDKRVARC